MAKPKRFIASEHRHRQTKDVGADGRPDLFNQLPKREINRRLRELFDAIEEGIVLLDRRLKVVTCNATMRKWAARKVIGLSCHTVICGRRTQCADCPGVGSLHDGKVHSRVMKSSLPGLPKDAWICVYAYPMRSVDGEVEGVVEFIQDITERRNLEQRVDRISSMERASMRRDIHDTLSQELTAITFLASNLKQDMPKDPAEVSRDVSRIAALAQEAIEQSRHLARGLEPLAEGPDALPRALLDLAAFITKTFKISCRAACQQSVHMPDRETSTQLFMLAREAAINAAKHSRGTRIFISLTQRTARIRLVVRDNGIGADTAFKETDGFGLRTMRERANLIGASLRVRSSQGKGTEVECRWNIG
jgi:PAS domain S-box-containing protein